MSNRNKPFFLTPKPLSGCSSAVWLFPHFPETGSAGSGGKMFVFWPSWFICLHSRPRLASKSMASQFLKPPSVKCTQNLHKLMGLLFHVFGNVHCGSQATTTYLHGSTLLLPNHGALNNYGIHCLQGTLIVHDKLGELLSCLHFVPAIVKVNLW